MGGIGNFNDGIKPADFKKWKETMGEEAEYALWRMVMIIQREVHDNDIPIRDRFAMAAMPGLTQAARDLGLSSEEFAKRAYILADAMMEARE